MIWPLAWNIIIGTIPGLVLGLFIRVWYLPDPRAFKLFVVRSLLHWRSNALSAGQRARQEDRGKISRNQNGEQAVASASGLQTRLDPQSLPEVGPFLAQSTSFLRMFSISHYRVVRTFPRGRASRGSLRHRWRSYHSAVHCLFLRFAHSHG